jgi:hypothetical protein
VVESPVEDAEPSETDVQLKAMIDASASGAATARDLYGDVVAVGPALWARLTSADPVLVDKAVPTTCILPGDPPAQYAAGTFQSGSVPALLASSAYVDLCKDLVAGEVRAATAFERDVYYAQVPYEIDEKEISVIEQGTNVLLVDFLDGKAIWLEMVSDWGTR